MTGSSEGSSYPEFLTSPNPLHQLLSVFIYLLLEVRSLLQTSISVRHAVAPSLVSAVLICLSALA